MVTLHSVGRIVGLGFMYVIYDIPLCLVSESSEQ